MTFFDPNLVITSNFSRRNIRLCKFFVFVGVFFSKLSNFWSFWFPFEFQVAPKRSKFVICPGVNLTFWEDDDIFRRIWKNQNLFKTKRIPNTNGIQEAPWVYWQDLGVRLLVGFRGGGQNPGSSGHFKVVKDTHREKITLKLNSSAYEKYKYRHLGPWYIKLTLFKRC